MEAEAPGKVILFGEHAVVYGRPAIAVPVFGVRARAVVTEAPPGSGLTVVAADLGRRVRVRDAPQDDPLALAARLALGALGAPEPDVTITVTSSIPIAGGLGSGAAVSAALIRALGAALGMGFELSRLNELVYEVEKLYHGTPSGIDNTVVVYGKPVYFVRGRPPEVFGIGKPFSLLIADTGISSPTREAVAAVRELYRSAPDKVEPILDEIGDVAEAARKAIEDGDVPALGPLMWRNHGLLQRLTVSCDELDRLVRAAMDAGAEGAKLSGGGRGGNMIALVRDDAIGRVESALRDAGAVRVLHTVVSGC